MTPEDGHHIAPAMLTQNSKSVFIDADRLQRLLDTSDEANRWDKCSIYRVPSYFIPEKEKFYKPQLVSVGPYHHGATHLNAMEEHKYRALCQFLKRSKKTINDFKVSMKGCVHQLMESYEKLDEEWKDEDKFLELMILDGCFVLEILRVFYSGGENIDYGPSDPIFSNRGLASVVIILVRDTLMLENQLPFLVLEKLLAVEDEKRTDSDEYLNELLSFVGHDICWQFSKLHIVDFLRSRVIGSNKNLPKLSYSEISEIRTRSLSQCAQAGIVFEKSERNFLSDIKLEKNVLHLPEFELNGFSEVIWLNLLAFECLHAGITLNIANYIVFMSCLLDKKEDVQILHSAQLLTIRALGDYQEIKELFGSLWNRIDFQSNSDLDYVMKDLDVYCMKSEKKWNRRVREWRLNLESTYFSSPWTVLSLIAATLIIALTILQTVFTALSYYNPPK
ncbi:UPF0481 protein At3g47200-like [Aristolochia californica]|uniref:UPF0481 protein At3g47200-like n=1 Tax=Aristolochia californica TaxID=171875 RepID=UPI0035D979CC